MILHQPERQHNGKCAAKTPSTLRTIIINKQRSIRPPPVIFFLALVSFCPVATAAHDYHIAVSDDLATMTVEARFDRPIDAISARSQDARQFLLEASDCENDKTLLVRSHRLSLPKTGIECLRYSVDLANAANEERLSSILRDGNIAVSPTVWMWRPRLDGGDEIIATFSLGAAAEVFLPWEKLNAEGTRYRLLPSPQSGSAIAVFGTFQHDIVNVAGAELRVVLPNTNGRVELQPMLPWVEATANSIAGAYGTFPNANAAVLLIPVGNEGWDKDSAVSFGRVVRDGGETIELMINQHQPVAKYYSEWTPVHEFSHLMLPYLDREQRWISEGFAQYYQNVFLARAGQHSAEDAWRKIYEGLERGRESAPGMSPNAAARAPLRDTRMKVYWSGASLALMADVEIRRRSAGEESLDSVLGQLQDCCLPSAYSWSGMELFRKLDSFLDKPLFVDLYRQYADSNAFPDARPVLSGLGISSRNGEVELDSSTELSDIRKAITARANTPL